MSVMRGGPQCWPRFGRHDTTAGSANPGGRRHFRRARRPPRLRGGTPHRRASGQRPLLGSRPHPPCGRRRQGSPASPATRDLREGIGGSAPRPAAAVHRQSCEPAGGGRPPGRLQRRDHASAGPAGGGADCRCRGPGIRGRAREGRDRRRDLVEDRQALAGRDRPLDALSARVEQQRHVDGHSGESTPTHPMESRAHVVPQPRRRAFQHRSPGLGGRADLLHRRRRDHRPAQAAPAVDPDRQGCVQRNTPLETAANQTDVAIPAGGDGRPGVRDARKAGPLVDPRCGDGRDDSGLRRNGRSGPDRRDGGGGRAGRAHGQGGGDRRGGCPHRPNPMEVAGGPDTPRHIGRRGWSRLLSRTRRDRVPGPSKRGTTMAS